MHWKLSFSKGNSSALPFINWIKSPSKSEIYLLASFKYESDKSMPVIFSLGNAALNCFNVLPDPVATSSIFIELFFLSLKILVIEKKAL